jgi:hypothetical protein
MKDGIPEHEGESWDDTKKKLKEFLKNEMNIKDPNCVQIDRAHRSGMKGQKPRPIIAKLMNSSSKDMIFKHVKNLKGKNQYVVQEQLPAEVSERRKRLWSKYKEAKENSANKVHWSLDKLVVNGSVLTANDDRSIITDEDAVHREIYTTHTMHSVTEGSTFIGHAAKIDNKSDVPTVLAGLLKDPMIGRATHNIYAFRFDDLTKPHGINQGFSDDGEHGAGFKLLKLLQDNEHTNVMVVVTRHYGNKNLGPKRFECIKNSATEALRMLV